MRYVKIMFPMHIQTHSGGWASLFKYCWVLDPGNHHMIGMLNYNMHRNVSECTYWAPAISELQ